MLVPVQPGYSRCSTRLHACIGTPEQDGHPHSHCPHSHSPHTRRARGEEGGTEGEGSGESKGKGGVPMRINEIEPRVTGAYIESRQGRGGQTVNE